MASSLTVVYPPTSKPIPIPPRKQSPSLDYPSNLLWPRRDSTDCHIRHGLPLSRSPEQPALRLTPQQRIVGFHVPTATERSISPSPSAPVSFQDDASLSAHPPLPVAPSALTEHPHRPRTPPDYPMIFFMDEELGVDDDCGVWSDTATLVAECAESDALQSDNATQGRTSE